MDRGKITADGYFEVMPDGKIYNLDGHKTRKKESKIYVTKTKSSAKNATPYVSNCIGGVQKHRNARVLVAKMYVPNPEGCAYTYCKDGNQMNLNPKNISWKTRKTAANEMLKSRTRVCNECGREYYLYKDSGLCGECRKKKESMANFQLSEKRRLKRIRQDLKKVDVKKLLPRERLIFEMRYQGNTLQEISDEIGVSKQRVEQILNKMIAGKYKKIKKETLKIRVPITKGLKTKVNKLDERILNYKAKIDGLTREKEILEEEINRREKEALGG